MGNRGRRDLRLGSGQRALNICLRIFLVKQIVSGTNFFRLR